MTFPPGAGIFTGWVFWDAPSGARALTCGVLARGSYQGALGAGRHHESAAPDAHVREHK